MSKPIVNGIVIRSLGSGNSPPNEQFQLNPAPFPLYPAQVYPSLSTLFRAGVSSPVQDGVNGVLGPPVSEVFRSPPGAPWTCCNSPG